MNYADRLGCKHSAIEGDWVMHHLAATRTPHPQERGIAGMIYSWLEYAEDHQKKFNSSIQEDSFLGPYWVQIGDALLGLLNGDTGRLDAGTLDHIIRDAVATEGCAE